jgi:hypothetical protein
MNLPININEKGTITVLKYRHDLIRSGCRGKGYIDIEASIERSIELLKKTSLYARPKPKRERQDNGLTKENKNGNDTKLPSNKPAAAPAKK